MKIYRFSIFLIFATLLGLLYVHQQVQLLKVSYNIASNEKECATLLDRRGNLVYNISQLKSPVNLGKRFLAANKDYGIPQQWQVVQVAAAPDKQSGQPAMMAIARKESFTIFKMMFRPKEAFAKTIK